MKRITAAAAVSFGIAIATSTASLAATQSIKGLRCEHFSESIYLPASQIKPSVLRKLRKGKTFWFTYPGFGRIKCTPN